ncbi:transglutaminase 5, like [Misgurnus anguillicaudatus]|uniref:transglutaminase 5, like n=1 Tax=Misgurnus anguillicaudatus TaxID=75329 RepID=UPI003CCFCAA9
MDEFKFKNADLQPSRNQPRHRTNGLSSTTLVLRRGQAFQILINFDGRAFDPRRDKLVFQVLLGPLSVEVPVEVPVSVYGQPSSSQWSATLEQAVPNPNSPRTISVSLFSPVSASVGVYSLSLRVETRTGVRTHLLGQFTLLCNPWSRDDSVFLSAEDQRDEYVMSDFGVLFKGTPGNIVARPWSFDQYERGILDICMKLLQLSPQYLADKRRDLLNRSSPVYIGRVVSAMINSQDDQGVLMGKWSGEYDDGINPSLWSGSADILQMWSASQFRPVKYGQCWVFAAVMCTVMRALGIPTRVVTNFNSAHDTNGNMVIEEYYSEFGEKLPVGRDSIWNFHVWVESWMQRPDLGEGFDGWQVLDPTPQEISSGMYRCGPASLKAIREKEINAQYDVPFVYAEVNADVRTILVQNGKILGTMTDTKRVGALVCTKRIGSMQMQNLTSDYKTETDDKVIRPFAARMRGEDSSRTARQGVAVSLSLLKAPVVGESIVFNVIITNNGPKEKVLKVHINAQHKEYHRNPTAATFWEIHNDLKIAPNLTRTFKHEISYGKYARDESREDDLVNLAVVLEDVETQERVLASEEFNISSPTLSIQIPNEYSVIVNTPQAAIVSFTNPFNVSVSGELKVTGAGLLDEKIRIRLILQPGEAMKRPIQFIPKMPGARMLQASLALTNLPSLFYGFKTINVKQA